MPEPTPTPTSSQTLVSQIVDKVLKDLSGDEAPRPLESYSGTELRQLWRAGRITEQEWNAELVARGDSAQSANDEIARQKNIGVSTAASTRGQLTASESAAVASLKASAPPPPAPVANAAASATAGGQAGAGGIAESPGGELAARQPSAGTFGGTAQPGSARALTAPQQGGGGGPPAKPKPIRWSTSLNAWVRDTGRKDASGGNIVEIVDGPPPPEGSLAGGKRGDQRLVWDAVAKAYRQVEWDSGDQEWVWTDKLQNLPPIQRTAEIGRAHV